MTMFILPRMNESDSAFTTEGTGAETGFGALRTSVGNLPLKQLHYRTRIVGLAIQTTIAQTYYNPFDECIEATYIFPVEGEQAVTDCEMWIGTRVVRAALKERGQARADYQDAISRGYRAALLEENRPETFSMKVGNIAPGEAIQVRIETVGHLPVVGGEWTLRIPLVVAPKYTSGFAMPSALLGNAAGEGVALDTDQVPDASAVTPPIWLPGFASPVDLKLEVKVTPGALAKHFDWPKWMRSSLHAVSMDLSGEGESKSCIVRVLPGERVNRDFILRGRYSDSSVAAAVVVEASPRSAATTPVDDRSTIAIQLVPPKADAVVPRDIAFLLDRSGSMSGWKMDAARRGISRLIDSLSPKDRFRVIVFDDKVESPMLNGDGLPLGKLFAMGIRSQWALATDENRYEAVRWLAKIDSRGGTEMGMAIKRAMEDFGALPCSQNESTVRSRAMVLVTDGQITGEDSLIRLLGQTPEAQRPRMFCLGVDRAVNGSVLQRLTKFTGGTYELVESQQRLDEVLNRFAGEFGSPALSELEVVAENSTEDLQWVPGGTKTVYAGRGISFYGRVKVNTPLVLTVHGRLASGQPWKTTLEVPAQSEQHDGAATLLPLWARGRIRELEDALISKPSQDTSQKNEIIACSLSSHVLSRFTAFVAVDETEQVNINGQIHKVMQPVEFPDGWQSLSSVVIDRSLLIPLPGKQTTLNEAKQSSEFQRRSGITSLPPAFKSLVVGRGIVSAEQWNDADAFASRSGKSICDVLLEMNYATPEQIAKGTAEAYRLPYMDLKVTTIDDHVIELVPESVSRENMILPVGESNRSLTIAMSDPADLETVEKLRFILNREIHTVVASQEAILNAINERYGQIEGESADSMLQEFTDTAIDFTETSDDLYELSDIMDAGFYNGLSSSVSTLAAPAPSSDHFTELETDERIISEPLAKLASRSFQSPIARLRSAVTSLVGKPASAPVVRLVQLLIAEAVALRASHIILRPQDDAIEVVYLIDDKEVPRDRVPARLTAAIVTRLKVLCNLDVTAPKPQESGQCEFVVNGANKTCQIHFRETDGGISMLIELISSPAEERPDAVKVWWAQ